uniref:Protein-tyrosine phosphatase mitochondrial 1 n=1 Tax=Aegilops tauschii TaxID=37682 RepID=M8CCD1_AEGTA
MAAAESFGLRRGAGARARRKAKEAAVGAAARALFYPTLLYNVVRSKVQAEFRWWDEVDQSRGIDHLVIPTRDYMFAPSLVDISQAVDFIHRNASRGRMTYIHCKAGRGRSTTIVLCYLVKYKNMTPTTAFEHVRSKRARVLLTRSQRKVVQEFSTKVAGTAAATSSSPSGDAVPQTEDGSGLPGVVREDASLPSHTATPSGPMMKKMLACLLPSPTRSGGASPSHADLRAP